MSEVDLLAALEEIRDLLVGADVYFEHAEARKVAVEAIRYALDQSAAREGRRG